jgi:uncharacterized protein YcgL (UPF0745 family)
MVAASRDAQDVQVFKSTLKADTYLYLPVDGKFDDLPDGLRATFGAPEFVMDFHLNLERKLARADAKSVLRALEEQGFYLQLAPTLEELQRDG